MSDELKRQAEFVTWLKKNMMYNPMDNSHTMHRMHMVWEKFQPKQQEPEKAEYTEGICQDGAGILKDGGLMTVSEILSELNKNQDNK